MGLCQNQQLICDNYFSWPVDAGSNYLVFCWVKCVHMYTNLHNNSEIPKDIIISAKFLLERRKKSYNWIINLIVLSAFLEFCFMCVHINATLQGGRGWFLLISWGIQLSNASFSSIMWHSSNVFLDRGWGKLPASPVSALQKGADGTARRGRAGPLRRAASCTLSESLPTENCQLTKLRVFPLGVCFCQNLSDPWNPSNCP